MKKTNYITILVILIIILFLYTLYLQYYSSNVEGLTDVLTQTTTNNNPTNPIHSLQKQIILYFNNINALTFTNDPAKTPDNFSRVKFSNIVFTVNNQHFDINKFIGYYLKNTNSVDIAFIKNITQTADKKSAFPGKITTKVSDNSKYNGIDFNTVINAAYNSLSNNITNINVVRNPNIKTNPNGPMLTKIAINSNFKITVNGKEFKINETVIPLDAVINLLLVDVESINITIDDPAELYNYLDKNTNVPLASSISLKN
jgi:hypothetical protein